MTATRLDRRNRKCGSLRGNSKIVHVQLSDRTLEILDALRTDGDQRISYGAMIDNLVAMFAPNVPHGTVFGQKVARSNELD